MTTNLTLPTYLLSRIEAQNLVHKKNSNTPLAIIVISSNDLNLAHFNASNYHFLEQIAKTHLVYLKVANGEKNIVEAINEGTILHKKKARSIVLNGHGFISYMQMGSDFLTPYFATQIPPDLLEKDAMLFIKSCQTAKYFAPEWMKNTESNWSMQAPETKISSSRTFFVDGQMLAYDAAGALQTVLFTKESAKVLSTTRSFEDLMKEKEAYLIEAISSDASAPRQLGLVHHYLAEYYYHKKDFENALKYYELVKKNQYWKSTPEDKERLSNDLQQLENCYSLLEKDPINTPTSTVDSSSSGTP